MANSIFDLIGPIMIGPSSSHTAGVLRIARVAYELLGHTPTNALITFYNSFAKTYQGHGSDRAVLGGLLGYVTDDKRIPSALSIAKQSQLNYQFKSVPNALQLHPNTIQLQVTYGTQTHTIMGVSTGGGKILITELNGFEVRISATLYTLIIYAQDQPGSIMRITQILSHDNIATMTVARKAKNGRACLVIECDTPIQTTTQQQIQQLSWVESINYINKLY